MSDQTDRSMQDLKPTVWIGKQGCTKTMIEEIVAQLKKRKLIKVKCLQNTEVDPDDIAIQAKATLMEVRGRTMVLAAKGKGVPEKSVKAGNPAKPPESARSRVIGKLKPAKK
ncbi:MAG: YhbY family RNA-binding protein [Methanoregula sp.]